MNHKLKNGEIITIGMQNLKTETVPVTYNNSVIECELFQDENGDIGFIFEEEYVYFRDL